MKTTAILRCESYLTAGWLMVNQKHIFLIALKITIPRLNQANIASVCCHLTTGSSSTLGKTYKTGQIKPNSFPGISVHF